MAICDFDAVSRVALKTVLDSPGLRVVFTTRHTRWCDDIQRRFKDENPLYQSLRTAERFTWSYIIIITHRPWTPAAEVALLLGVSFSGAFFTPVNFHAFRLHAYSRGKYFINATSRYYICTQHEPCQNKRREYGYVYIKVWQVAVVVIIFTESEQKRRKEKQLLRKYVLCPVKTYWEGEGDIKKTIFEILLFT